MNSHIASNTKDHFGGLFFIVVIFVLQTKNKMLYNTHLYSIHTHMTNEEITTIAMRNETRRSFQGIKPGQVVSIDESDVEAYKSHGFVIVTANEDEVLPVVEDDQEKKLTKAELIAKLKDLKVPFDKKQDRDELQAIYDEAIKGNDVANVDDADLGLGDNAQDESNDADQDEEDEEDQAE